MLIGLTWHNSLGNDWPLIGLSAARLIKNPGGRETVGVLFLPFNLKACRLT